MSKLDSPVQLRLYIVTLIRKVKTKFSQIHPQIQNKQQKLQLKVWALIYKDLPNAIFSNPLAMLLTNTNVQQACETSKFK